MLDLAAQGVDVGIEGGGVFFQLGERVAVGILDGGSIWRAIKTMRLGGTPGKAQLARLRADKARAGVQAAAFAPTPKGPEVDHEGNPLLQSAAFMIADQTTGAVILEKNSDSVVPIASASAARSRASASRKAASRRPSASRRTRRTRTTPR